MLSAPLLAGYTQTLNDCETYCHFGSLFCPPDHVTEKKKAFAEVINGDGIVNARYQLHFRGQRLSLSTQLSKKMTFPLNAEWINMQNLHFATVLGISLVLHYQFV